VNKLITFLVFAFLVAAIITDLVLFISSCQQEQDTFFTSQNSVVEACETDTIEAWIKVENWVTCDSVNYQWDNWNEPGYGFPVQIQIWDSCGGIFNNWTWGTQQSSIWLWSGERKKVKVKKGWCIVWGLEWFPCSPVAPDLGYPLEIAIFADENCTQKIWPDGSLPVLLFPEYYNGPPSAIDPSQYTGYNENFKVLEDVCIN